MQGRLEQMSIWALAPHDVANMFTAYYHHLAGSGWMLSRDGMHWKRTYLYTETCWDIALSRILAGSISNTWYSARRALARCNTRAKLRGAMILLIGRTVSSGDLLAKHSGVFLGRHRSNS
jgi:hypothetical protein